MLRGTLFVIIGGMKNRLLFALALPILSLCAVAQTPNSSARCGLTAIIADQTTATTAQMVAIPTGNSPKVYVNGTAQTNPLGPSIRVCSVQIRIVQPATPTNFGFVYGTGTNCATGQANVTPQYVGTASTTEQLTQTFGYDAAITVPAGKALCFKTSAVSTHAQVLITYQTQ